MSTPTPPKRPRTNEFADDSDRGTDTYWDDWGADSVVPLTPLPDPHRISSVSTVRDSESIARKRSSDKVATPPRDSRPRKRRARKMQITEEVVTDVWDGQPASFTEPPADDDQIIAGRYRVQETLGTGGMARIYKVQHINLGKEFALKIIHPQAHAVKRIQQLFFREAKVASVMDHPNIVQVTDFGVDTKIGAYIVMEHLKGDTLHARLRKRKKLRLGIALDIALQTAEALHYMHGHNIIHCDIKAENIFLCRPQAERRKGVRVKLIDFGLSRIKTGKLKLAKSEVAGTPQYMAPELIRGSAPQPGMDIYSLGIIMYEMFTGKLPFVGKMEEVISAQLFSEPEPPSTQVDGGLDDGVEQFILKALQKDPARRQSSMGHVILELRTLMEKLHVQPPRLGKPVQAEAETTDARAYKQLFETCPCPMFRLDNRARILLANTAFCRFVRADLKKLVGNPIDDTRLAYVYPNIYSDVTTWAKRKRKQPIQRVLSFELADGKSIAMQCWLIPDVQPDGSYRTFSGFIHPTPNDTTDE